MKKKTSRISPRSIAHRVAQRLFRLLVKAFYNVAFRTKLFIYAGVLIGLMLVLAGFALSQIDVIQSRLLPARAAAREMESALLTLHSNEQQFINEANGFNTEFYLKRQSRTLQAWQESYEQFQTNYEALLVLYPDASVKQLLETTKPKVIEYRDTFLTLASTYQQRGFQTFGREGALQQRADMLEASLANRPSQEVFLLKLRHAQDKFLLHKDTAAIVTFNDYAGQLERQLSKNEDKVALEEYQRLFQDVVQLDEKIGLTSGSGLRGTLNTLMGQLQPYVQEVEESVLDATTERVGAISRSITYTSILVVIVAIVMAILLSRFITRRLRLLLNASQRIAAGDFSERIRGQAADELGRLSDSFNIMTDTLQRSQAALHQRADALAESVRRFELVSKAVNEAIYEWNIETDRLEWGEGIVSSFGYDPKDKVTTVDWWAQHIHADDAESVNTALAEHIRRRVSSWKKVYRFKKANGQYAYCRDQGFIEYRHGRAVRMVGSLVDITHEKELDRAKDEFISVASHQLRTPLGSIRWNLELLMDKLHTLPKDTADYINEAYKSTMRMLGLVSDLLSVARIEQHRVQDMPMETNIVSVVMMAIDEMKPIAAQRKVRINATALKHKTITLLIDPKRFREVVQNLLSNAVKYTPSGGKVTLVIAAGTKGVVLSVADNGLGIPTEDYGNLFTKFFRAKNVTTTDTEGSGLGLFVVKSYVEGWGGRIWFESQLNHGTTFYVSIPSKPRINKKLKPKV